MSGASIWAYPWDLHDIGLDAACARIADAGMDMVSLATSYHAGRFLSPGNPRRRVIFPQDGTVYYRPDPTRWAGAEIVPLMADIVAGQGDMLAALCARRDAGGLAVSCWTVCLHNTRLGMAHPAHVMRSAHGDAHVFALCPSSPAARAYVTGLVAEVSETYRPDRIEIESPDFMGFSHGFHHEKDGLGLLPEDEFLLGVCFCAHCMARASGAGIPAEAARTQAAALLDAAFARAWPAARFPDFPAAGLAAFAGYPALHAFLHWRCDPVTALMEELAQACHPDSALMLIDAAGTWRGGIDLPAIAPHVAGVIHCAYTTPPAQIAADLGQARAALGPGKALIAGFQVCVPPLAGAADLAARVAQTRGLVEGHAFYNLGLIPPARLGAITAALAR